MEVPQSYLGQHSSELASILLQLEKISKEGPQSWTAQTTWRRTNSDVKQEQEE
jgi:hypothetical protein